MSFMPKPYEIYQHFKGNLYQILAIAEHSETGEPLVVYQALYEEFKIYARPLAMFTEKVDKEKYPDAVQEYRFELRGSSGSIVNAEPTYHVQGNIVSGMQQPKEISAEEVVAEEEIPLDPLVLEFLDADSYEQRLNILAGLHHRITDQMITTMALVCDIEVAEGDIEERYESLRSCLLTLEKYECNRLR